MEQKIRYVHTNLVARDWKRLASFYIDVFGCQPLPPERDLSGAWISKLTGIEAPHIRGIHLALPGYDREPSLEIFSYSPEGTASDKAINQPGFAHIAFHVTDVNEMVKLVISHGGSLLGEIVTREYDELGLLTVAYCRDPEGNIIEIQNWKK